MAPSVRSDLVALPIYILNAFFHLVGVVNTRVCRVVSADDKKWWACNWQLFPSEKYVHVRFKMHMQYVHIWTYWRKTFRWHWQRLGLCWHRICWYFKFRSHRRNLLRIRINPGSVVLMRTTSKIGAFCRRGSRLTKVNAAVLGFVHVVTTRASCCSLCIGEAEIHAAKRAVMKRLENIVIVVQVEIGWGDRKVNAYPLSRFRQLMVIDWHQKVWK